MTPYLEPRQMSLLPWQPPLVTKPQAARVIVPDHGAPPTDGELDEMQSTIAERLAAYQDRLALFSEVDPPLPVRWDNWREAGDRAKRRARFVRAALKELGAARDRFRRALCAR